MKKILALLLSLMLVVGLFAACGEKTDEKKGDEAGQKATSYDSLAAAIELTSEEYGIACRKGSDLTAEINTIMDELNEDGTLAELAEKYKLALCEDAEAYDNGDVTVEDVAYIKENGKLVIGITDYEPMNYKDDKGEWTGFDTEFALAVCKKLGVEAEFVEIDWDNKFVALESKAIDCIWNGMTISEEVLKNTSCSKAYVKNAQVVVMDKDAAKDCKSVDDIKNLTFAVEAGSAGAAAAEENKLDFVEVGTQTDALLEVTSGSCDACIIDLTMANAVLGK